MPQISPQEQEEFEFRARMEREQGTQQAIKPANAAEELKAKHAKNVSAEQAIYKPSLGDVWTEGYNKGGAGMALAHTMGEMGQDWKEVLQKTPERLGGMASGLYEAVTKPAQVGMQIPEMIRKGTEPLISPRTTGKALMEAGVDTALTMGAAKTPGLVKGIAERSVAAGANRVKGLTYSALSEGIGPRSVKAQRLERELERGMEPVFDFAKQANRKINTVDDLGTAAKDMTKVTDVEFNSAVESVGDRMVSGSPIAAEIRAEITDLVKRQNPAQADGLERLAASFDRDMPIREVNQLRQDVTGKLDNWYSKSPLQREHSPLGIEADSAMADGLRNVLYDNLEQIFPDEAMRQMMRERGAAEGISKFASESAGAARRGEMAATEARGLITTPLTKGAKLAKAAISPRETLIKKTKYLQRPDRKISEAYKLYIPKKSTISAPIGQPGPHGLPPQGPTPDDLLQNAGGQIRYNPSAQSANALSPQFQPNPNLDRDVVAAWRAQAAGGPSRNLTIGEAASQGVDVPLSQTLKYQLSPDAAFQEFLDNMLRNRR